MGSGPLFELGAQLLDGRPDAVDVLDEALDPLLSDGLSSVVTEEFMSSHWLASFAWDALISAR